MVQALGPRGRLVPVVGAGTLIALVAGSLTSPAQAEIKPVQKVAAVECPVAVPMSSVKAGMTGEGLTVVTGSTPQPFKVDVLGVLNDGIGAGRDMIIIKVSDVAGGHVIDQGGGIWAGMSGSPVYVDGQLLGAVSYGFTASPSPIGGLTPAADMLDILKLGGVKAAKTERVSAAKTEVRLSASARVGLASKARVATPKGTLQQLVTPLAVSGLGPQRISKLQSATDAAGWSVKAYAAGRRSAPKAAAVPTARPQAGGNFAAALSYGDLTAAAIGTTTAVCGDRAIAFGHPFNLTGPASYGANDADAVAIIKDDTFGAFKLANVGADFGTVDQDRTAGIRADLTSMPAGTNVTATIRNLDSGKSRTGTTTVVDQASLAGLLVPIVFTNQDAVFDEWSDGTSTTSWTISGTRAGGTPFRVTRSNRWASRADVTVEPAYDIASAVDALVNNDYEDVKVKSVTFGQNLATTFEQSHITRMRVSVNRAPYSTAKVIKVKPGDRLTIRVDLSPYRSTASSAVDLTMVVPKNAKGKRGAISATGGVDLAGQGGGTSLECLLTGACAEAAEGSLNAVIAGITSTPRNDAVVAELNLESNQDSGDKLPPPAVTVSKLHRLTVTGQRSLEIAVS